MLAWELGVHEDGIFAGSCALVKSAECGSIKKELLLFVKHPWEQWPKTFLKTYFADSCPNDDDDDKYYNRNWETGQTLENGNGQTANWTTRWEQVQFGS